MSYCKIFTTQKSSYTLIAGGVSGAFLQLQSGGPVVVRVASSLPDDTDIEGVFLNLDGLAEIQLLDLEAGDNVYIRSVQDEDNRVLVLAPGESP